MRWRDTARIDHQETIMTTENPTVETDGASTLERLESYLAAQEGETQPQPEPKAQEPVEATPETTEAEPAGDEPTESDEPQISLSDLAKYLGMDETALDVDDDGTVKVKTKIDGAEGTAKLNDLVKSYQLQGHVDAKAREAAEQAKALQERVTQFEQYAQQEAQKLSQLAHIANQELMRDVAEIDWQSLARNDPAEYVAKQAEFQSRQARVTQLVQAADQQNSQWQQAQQMRTQQTLQTEAARLPTLIPEWADTKVAETERSELKAWMKAQGYSDQDIGSIYRADMVSTLRKAWLYDKGQQKTAITEKKVRVAPKLVKPGQPASQSDRNDAALRDLKQNIRKSSGRNGIAEYLMAAGKV